MAYRTISLQPPWRPNTAKAIPGEEMQDYRQGQPKVRKTRTNCATLACSRAFIRVPLERREHHGPYEVTVAGPSPSQSSIRSGFFGPAIFQAKAPTWTPCSGSFSKGSRAKAHVHVRPRSNQIHWFEQSQNTKTPIVMHTRKKSRTSKVCRYTFVPCGAEDPFFSSEGERAFLLLLC
jgi:hypothetical protein